MKLSAKNFQDNNLLLKRLSKNRKGLHINISLLVREGVVDELPKYYLEIKK